jgi:hypothetical protein
MGADSSDYKVRGYEKGYEQLAKINAPLIKKGLSFPAHASFIHPQTGELVRPQDWFRLELQIRPRTEEGRFLISHASPEQAWGITDWTRELARETMALDLAKLVLRTRKNSAFDETTEWVCRQYGKHLDNLIDLHGHEGAMRLLQQVYRRQQSSR